MLNSPEYQIREGEEHVPVGWLIELHYPISSVDSRNSWHFLPFFYDRKSLCKMVGMAGDTALSAIQKGLVHTTPHQIIRVFQPIEGEDWT